tara:strand:+ start:126 stop:572 length:447 start_codon:yes stop_codon:yes gene_type:complete
MIDSKTNRILPKDLPGREEGAVHLGTTSRVKAVVGCVYTFYYRSTGASTSPAFILLLDGGAWKSNGKRKSRPSRRYYMGVNLKAFSEEDRRALVKEFGPHPTVSLQDVEGMDDVSFPEREKYVRTYDLRKIRSLHTIDIATYLGKDIE